MEAVLVSGHGQLRSQGTSSQTGPAMIEQTEALSHNKHASETKPSPPWATRPYRVFRERFIDEHEMLHLSIRGLRHLMKMPTIVEVLAQTREKKEDLE